MRPAENKSGVGFMHNGSKWQPIKYRFVTTGKPCHTDLSVCFLEVIVADTNEMSMALFSTLVSHPQKYGVDPGTKLHEYVG